MPGEYNGLLIIICCSGSQAAVLRKSPEPVVIRRRIGQIYSVLGNVVLSAFILFSLQLLEYSSNVLTIGSEEPSKGKLCLFHDSTIFFGFRFA